MINVTNLDTNGNEAVKKYFDYKQAASSNCLFYLNFSNLAQGML